MKATIITIGDEILIGQIVDTNSASIARHLNAAGIVVAEKESVGDDRDAIVAALRRAMDSSDVTILTGGLGPTKDDITKRTLAELFSCELVRDERVARHVRRMLESRGIAYNDLNRGQSLVPACCTVLFNAHGTAPGMWFERDGRVVVSLPGVPFEMEHLMQDEVMPRLKARFALRQIVHRTLITSGLAESMLAERIAGWEAALPPYLHLAYLPSPDKVRLRLSAYEVEGEEVAHEIEAQFEKLRTIIPEYILGYETATIQSVVHDLLTQRHLTLATAESCTGGAIAARFTAMPGASAYFRCGVVSYTVEAKHDLLGVSLDDIDRYGVVSEPVVRAMAEGMRRTAHTDYAVATTGVAGYHCRRRAGYGGRRPRGRHARMSGRNGLDGRGGPAGNRRRLPAIGQRPRPDHRSCVGTGHRPAARRDSAAGYTPKRIDPCTKIPERPRCRTIRRLTPTRSAVPSTHPPASPLRPPTGSRSKCRC